uniref:Candidate secreted effector n=1 Tax=Meloidogyne incognita TaxID=6306 RepID=A0A914MXU0_MELIC
MNKFHILLLLLAILTITVLSEAAQTAALENSNFRMLLKREVAAIRAKRFGWGSVSLIRESRATRVKRFGWGCCGCGCGCCGGFGGIGLFAFGK